MGAVFNRDPARNAIAITAGFQIVPTRGIGRRSSLLHGLRPLSTVSLADAEKAGVGLFTVSSNFSLTKETLSFMVGPWFYQWQRQVALLSCLLIVFMEPLLGRASAP